jgi:hypothetical protein
LKQKMNSNRLSLSSPKIRSGEWRFASLVILIMLILTSLPYAYAALTVPPEKHFMGFILNVSDHSQYLAWYKGFQSAFLISNKLTPEPNPPIFFNLLWWMLGRFGLYTGLSYVVVYQIFRWIAGAFFLGMVYAFAALVFPDVHRQRVAFLLIALGSGFGWILVVLKYTLMRGELLFPLDVYIAEGNSFLCVLAYPHFAEAAGLILAVLGLLLIGERQGQLRYAVLAGLVAHFLGWQHGYDLLIVWAVPAAYIVARWVRDRRLPTWWVKALFITGLLSWPPALYAVLLTRLDPTWKEVLAQFANAGVFTPNFPHMLILLGLPFILAIVTVVLFIRDARRRRIDPAGPLLADTELFVGVWFVVGWALTYVPTDFQIHMLNSWQVPIGLLATVGLFRYIGPALRQRWDAAWLATLFVPVFMVLILLTNLYLWMWRFVDLNRYRYPYYLYRDEVAAMEWLADHSPPDAIVLSSYDTGRYMPALGERRAFLAHWAQTLNFYDKRERVERFFDARVGDAERLETLQIFGVDYVLYGPAERALGQYDPGDSPFFSAAFSNPQVKIYRVNTEEVP